MSTEKELATPEQARELMDEVITLMDHKGHRYITESKVYWRGDRVFLPAFLRERAKTTDEAAQNFHISAELSDVTALNELAIVTLTAPQPVDIGFAALRYKIVPRTGLRDLIIECHEFESLLPKIPSERETVIFDDNPADDFPIEAFNNPTAFSQALIESAAVNMLRHEIELSEQEATARALGNFVTSSTEAAELIQLIHNIANT